jgi:DeoR family fructose operon transcriptional repressor
MRPGWARRRIVSSFLRSVERGAMPVISASSGILTAGSLPTASGMPANVFSGICPDTPSREFEIMKREIQPTSLLTSIRTLICSKRTLGVNMTDRHNAILDLLLERGRLHVSALADHFGVTAMTVRRDLHALEACGLVTRTHGGAVLRAPLARELAFNEKVQCRPAEKEAIARAVVTRLRDGETLYLDTGSTCAAVARLLPGLRRNLRVFTNSLQAALDLFGAEGIEVVIPGGTLGRRSPDLTGTWALERLRLIRVDVAVIGADGLDPDRAEFYSSELPTGELSRLARERAQRVFAAVDSSKIGCRGLAVAGTAGKNLTLFTDAGAKRNTVERLEKLGMEVVIVHTAG